MDDADEGQDGGEGSGLEELEQDAITLDAAQGQDPGGGGGTDVGAHDDVNCLAQAQQAGVNETDDHNGGGGGGLDDGGDSQTSQETQQAAGGQLAEDGTKTGTGPAFQGAAHNVHAEQEQAKAANHG